MTVDSSNYAPFIKNETKNLNFVHPEFAYV